MDLPLGRGAYQFYIIKNDLAMAVAENHGKVSGSG